ncbi:hypothetical protein BGW36DRAFT_413608 [Talaromyces proteolyticus]|uniref:N-acetyltransferase domain-containing protein n=1 Tax=Talaromyces proteolyticus TaxID=1131652 RepID=A0AAD4L4L3_9EURO|nr:uncharacterized protein BGW36DRAFT_413608 [Talaromyces proteolyticus]KAH8705803.1 hypothetical protein BGW36DRAFT_413608 [Talaromyces proteolyticus]
MANTSPASQCRLEPIILNDEDQFIELQRQRVLCGWDYDPETIKRWKVKQEEKLKSLFWITIPDSSDKDKELLRTGHISLDANSSFDPPELKNFPHVKNCVFSISSFFILPEYRSYGLGRHAMKMAEDMAVKEPYGSPNCRFIALNALSKRYIYDEGPDWRGVWERLGVSPPSFSIQEWYEALGYVSWKEEPLYEEKALNGDIVKLWEAFMRKEVQRIA